MASLPMNPIEEQKIHEIDWYFSVRDRIDKLGSRDPLKDGIPVKMKTPLSNTLTRLSNSPAVSFTATRCQRPYSAPIAGISLTVGKEDAGTFGNPNIEKILEKSKPSPFGRGDKTVMDLEYRNGREIEGKDIKIGSQAEKRALYNLIETQISESLFVDKAVEIDLYKLAVYGKDGHFDWHRDTTHGDDHHATVLVGLNTEWKGGNLGLKYEGKTVDVDMHAVMRDEDVEDEEDDESSDDEQDGDEAKKPEDKRSILGFQIVAFYTDIEHKVESITDGTRIVLQFDVNVPGGQSPNEDEDLDLCDIPDGSGKPVLDTLKPLLRFSEADANRDAILEELVGMIQNLHTSQSINEVVFPLRHLYRLASIKPEYLKGVDGYLYEGLKKKFEVGLKPIVLIYQNYDGDWNLDEALAYPFVSVHDDEHEGDKKPPKRRKIEWKSEIHIPARYELTMISSTDYIEHTGNEAQTGEGKYFGAAMFVTAKAA